MLYRDIKPANLLINCRGSSKITDFGISVGLENTFAECISFKGTVTYMSPERIVGQPYSFPADIWSLGLSLFELATGKYPYNSNAVWHIRRAALDTHRAFSVLLVFSKIPYLVNSSPSHLISDRAH